MTRRQVIAALGGAAIAFPLAAGAAAARPRIAILTLDSRLDESRRVAAFLDGLRSLGYVDGQSVEIDERYAEADTARLTGLAAELIALKPDVALGVQPSAARALNGVAPRLPIVCPGLSDALVPSLVASYARPGGSVTGIAASVEGLVGKLVELTLETVPGTDRIGFLSNPAGASMRLFAQQIETAARTRGIAVVTEEARVPDDLAQAFDGFAKAQARALIVPVNGLFLTQRKRIVALTLQAHLPSIFTQREDVEAGGLVSYGVDLGESLRRAAVFVDKILKGAKPADLPVEFPTKIEMTVNLKTAKVLGLTIPPAVMLRADEVIE